MEDCRVEGVGAEEKAFCELTGAEPVSSRLERRQINRA